MDCCFNRYIPKSKPDLLVIRPSSKTFVNGMAESYAYDAYEEHAMKGILTQSEFQAVVERINNAIYNEYPCPGCQLFAYCCCLCTLGCSCVIPYCQVKGAMKKARTVIMDLNKKLEDKKVKLELKVEKSTSFILMYLPSHQIWRNQTDN